MGTDGIVFDIQRWSLHDGPGIRTNVFLKGCPLSCDWCSNPESQERNRELAYFQDKCIGCASCVSHCPHHALELSKGLQINYKVCREMCYFSRDEENFTCVGACYAKALKIMGKKMGTDEIIKEVLSDSGIYSSSGGGLTVTGGEPFAQPDFLQELLRQAKDNHLHNTVESCMYAKWEQIESCLEYIDFLFMDLKILDRDRHRKYTGQDNELILENMKKVGEFARNNKITVVIRTPIIPGVNDTAEDTAAVCCWIRENVPGVKVYQLLPYHRLGRGKYKNIGKKYKMEEKATPEEKKIKELEQIIMDHGLEIRYE